MNTSSLKSKIISLVGAIDTLNDIGQDLEPLDSSIGEDPRISPKNSKIEISLNKKMATTLKNYFFSTIVCYCTFSDYDLCTILIQSLFAMEDSRSSIKLSASIAYMTVFYSICSFCFNSGLLISLSCYGAQAAGKLDYARLNLLLRQSLVFSFISFVVIGGIGYHLLPFFLQVLKAAPSEVVRTQKLILLLAPSMVMKAITDTFKIYMQVLSEVKQFGAVYTLHFICFLSYSYFIVEILEYKLRGYAFVITVYQIIGLAICANFYYKKLPQNYRDESLPIFLGFSWHLKEAYKNTLIVFWYHLSQLFLVYFVSTTRGISEVGALSILLTAQTVIFNFFNVLSMYPGTLFNQMIARGFFEEARTLNYLVSILFTALSVFSHCLILLLVELFGDSLPFANPQIGQLIKNSVVPWTLLSSSRCLQEWINSVIISVEQKWSSIAINMPFGFVSKFLFLVLTIQYFEVDLSVILMIDACVMIVRTWFLNVTLIQADWKNIEGLIPLLYRVKVVRDEEEEDQEDNQVSTPNQEGNIEDLKELRANDISYRNQVIQYC